MSDENGTLKLPSGAEIKKNSDGSVTFWESGYTVTGDSCVRINAEDVAKMLAFLRPLKVSR